MKGAIYAVSSSLPCDPFTQVGLNALPRVLHSASRYHRHGPRALRSNAKDPEQQLSTFLAILHSISCNILNVCARSLTVQSF